MREALREGRAFVARSTPLKVVQLCNWRSVQRLYSTTEHREARRVSFAPTRVRRHTCEGWAAQAAAPAALRKRQCPGSAAATGAGAVRGRERGRQALEGQCSASGRLASRLGFLLRARVAPKRGARERERGGVAFEGHDGGEAAQKAAPHADHHGGGGACEGQRGSSQGVTHHIGHG